MKQSHPFKKATPYRVSYEIGNPISSKLEKIKDVGVKSSFFTPIIIPLLNHPHNE